MKERKGGEEREWEKGRVGKRRSVEEGSGEEEPFVLPEGISLSVGSPTSVNKENSS